MWGEIKTVESGAVAPSKQSGWSFHVKRASEKIIAGNVGCYEQLLHFSFRPILKISPYKLYLYGTNIFHKEKDKSSEDPSDMTKAQKLSLLEIC